MITARRDPEATKERKFLDPRSYCTLGGKAWLYGKDMEALRRECYQRSVGYCEVRFDGIRCERSIDWSTFELHHEPPLSKGGWDCLDLVLASCPRCHRQRHGRLIGGRREQR